MELTTYNYTTIQIYLELLYSLLYNNSMTSIASNYFSSKSKSQVLEILYYHSQPIHLRLIHKLSDLSIHAVDLAVKELEELKILKTTQIKNKKEYLLNTTHRDYQLIHTILKAIKEFQNSKRSKSYHSKAKATLSFINDASNLIKSGKASIRK
jgi:DNA-binding transcriptional regulator GbsR (MarR family)